MATPLDATEPRRRELDARRLRTTATSATALQTPMISHVPSNPKKAIAKANEKQSSNSNRNSKALDIVFSEGAQNGQTFQALDVLGAVPTLHALPFDWPETTTACCLHCGERIVGRPCFAIVQRLKTRQLEPAHALFCNAGPAFCNLAWLEDEYAGSERSTAIALTRDAMRVFLGVREPFDRAPPRIVLAKFSHTQNGVSVAGFHASAGCNHSMHASDVGAAYTTLRAPLVTFAAVLETQRRQIITSRVEGAGPATDNETNAPSNSMTRTRGITRMHVRHDPVAENRPTGKPPAILAFIASQVAVSNPSWKDDDQHAPLTLASERAAVAAAAAAAAAIEDPGAEIQPLKHKKKRRVVIATDVPIVPIVVSDDSHSLQQPQQQPQQQQQAGVHDDAPCVLPLASAPAPSPALALALAPTSEIAPALPKKRKERSLSQFLMS
jgi:hypothetical protein